jgi:hypothetical protein
MREEGDGDPHAGIGGETAEVSAPGWLISSEHYDPAGFKDRLDAFRQSPTPTTTERPTKSPAPGGALVVRRGSVPWQDIHRRRLVACGSVT